MSDEIQPCPHCGGDPYFDKPQTYDDRRYMAMHLECCAKMQATIGYSKYWNMSQEAIKSHLKGELIRLWNTRVATPPTVSDDVAALRAALADLVRKRESILIDVRSAHSARGDGAASWMREDDRDFIRDLDLAFDAAEAALAKIKGVS